MLTPLLFILAIVIGLWLVLVAVLWAHRPSRDTAFVVLRLIPDVGRLCYRLIRDPRTPVGHKLALAGLAAYLASPIDLIPDFLPGIGSVDDVIVAGLVLGWVGRHTGFSRVQELWPGSPEGLAMLRRVISR